MTATVNGTTNQTIDLSSIGGGSNVDLTNVTTHIIPDTAGAYNIGSAAYPFQDIYLTENSLHLGSNNISITGGDLQVGDKKVAVFESNGNLNISGSLVATGSVQATGTVTAGSSAGDLIPSTLDTGLVSYYKFEDSVTDSKGSNDFTADSGVGFEDSDKSGGSKGAHIGYYNMATHGWPTDDNARSFSFWYKPSSYNAVGGVVSYGAGSNNRGFSIAWSENSSGKLKVDGYNNKNDNGSNDFGTTLTTDGSTWYHIVWTYPGSAGTYKWYVNGVNTGSGTFPSNSGVLETGAGNARIGATFYSTGEVAHGAFDELGVWSKELTSTEVTTLYNSGDGKVYDGTNGFGEIEESEVATVTTGSAQAFWQLGGATIGGVVPGDPDYASVPVLIQSTDTDSGATITNTGTETSTGISFVNAGHSTTKTKFGTSSIYISGSDYSTVSIAQNYGLAFGEGNFTIETWVNFDVLEDNSMSPYINAIAYTGDLQPSAGSGNNWDTQGGSVSASGGWIFGMYTENDLDRFIFGWNGSHYRCWAWDFPNRQVDTWYHVAVVRDALGSGNTHLYIDGTKIAIQVDPPSNGSYNWTNAQSINAGGDLWLGHAPSWTGTTHPSGIPGNWSASYTKGGFTGYIEDFRITKGIARYSGNTFSEEIGMPSTWTEPFAPSLEVNSMVFTPDGNVYYEDGNVGIGTTAPNYDLHVVGDINATGDILIDGEQITGQVINSAFIGTETTQKTITATETVTTEATGGAADPYWDDTTLLLRGLDTDESSSGHSLSGQSISADGGKFGAGYIFDGTADKVITIPKHASLEFGDGDFTIEFWWKTNNLTDRQDILTYGELGTTTEGLQITFAQTIGGGTQLTGMQFDFNAGGGALADGRQPSLDTNEWAVDTWYYIQLIRNGNDVTLYKDGTAILSDTISGGFGTWPAGSRLQLGARYNVADSFLDGALDDIRVTKGVARTPTTPSKTYNVPTVTVTSDDPHFEKVECLNFQKMVSKCFYNN